MVSQPSPIAGDVIVCQTPWGQPFPWKGSCPPGTVDVTRIYTAPGYLPAPGGGDVASAVGTTVDQNVSPGVPDWLTKIGKNIINPAFWKSVGLVAIGIGLIAAGVILWLGAEIMGVRNAPVARTVGR